MVGLLVIALALAGTGVFLRSRLLKAYRGIQVGDSRVLSEIVSSSDEEAWLREQAWAQPDCKVVGYDLELRLVAVACDGGTRAQLYFQGCGGWIDTFGQTTGLTVCLPNRLRLKQVNEQIRGMRRTPFAEGALVH